MKIERLIGIITILLQQDKVTAPVLAERFEVSRRTINRDIEDICMAGIPLVTTQGYGGGISIADGYKIDKSLLTQDELQTIFAGLKGMESVSETSHVAKLLDKLSSKDNPIVAEECIIIDLASHYQGSLTEKIKTIKKSIINQTIISFKYYYGKGESIRRIEPYRLLFKWSSWYVFGYCCYREAYRLFKLNRIWDLQNTDEAFSARNIPPEELLFDDYFSSDEIQLKAIFSKTVKHRLIEEYGIDSYIIMENGDLLFDWQFANYENMREWVFSFGDKVCVLEPKKLIMDRLHQAEHILKYQKA